MREWERRTFVDGRVQERVVLESAGRAVAQAIARHLPRGRVVAAVGGGNNGGDAVVAARTLQAWGREVTIVRVGAAGSHDELTHGHSVPLAEDARAAIQSADVIVDGILGTGATGVPRAAQAEAIRWINEVSAPVVAVDGPSGVDLTTGRAEGEAVAATLTVTFGAIKRGLLLYPGRQLAGRILLAEVGFPPAPEDASALLITDGRAAACLPRVQPDAHKGRRGLVGIVAGREGVAGAAILCAMGALRAGSGGVRLFSTASNRIPIQAAVPEAVFVARDSPDADGAMEGVRAILLGPGMGTDDDALELLRRTLSRFQQPTLLDADALTLLARDPGILTTGRAASAVLTPHPGELARPLDTEIPAVLNDFFAAAIGAAERFGCVVLAKGSPSLVAAPGAPVLVGSAGHSGVATGGMGDTLGGVVAALLAAGADPRDAAATGLHLAGRAAERAGRGRGLLPRDVAESLPRALRDLERTRREVGEAPFLLELPAPR
jgi:ADP-dependent NAD(P)H-hydrate dehydratase / NAD(P)H-hydrate epimerase